MTRVIKIFLSKKYMIWIFALLCLLLLGNGYLFNFSICIETDCRTNLAMFVERRISQDIELVVEQSNLKMHIKNVCSKSPILSKVGHDTYPMDKLILYNTHKIVYCLQPKVGSTSILNLFLNLLPEKDQHWKISYDNIHQKMYKEFSMKVAQHKIKLKKLVNKNHYFAFSFVRHPFDRLVSAYVDKIESNKTGYFQLHIANIKKKYGDVTFNNFLLYVLSTKGDPNEHWIPFYKTCSYCNFGYDQFIGRMETFERDMWYADIQLILSSMIYFIDARFL